MTHLKPSRPSNAMYNHPKGRPQASELYLDLAFFSRTLRDIASVIGEKRRMKIRSRRMKRLYWTTLTVQGLSVCSNNFGWYRAEFVGIQKCLFASRCPPARRCHSIRRRFVLCSIWCPALRNTRTRHSTHPTVFEARFPRYERWNFSSNQFRVCIYEFLARRCLNSRGRSKKSSTEILRGRESRI